MARKARRLDGKVPPMSMVKALPPRGGWSPFKEGDFVIFLGEILGMPGHCAVMNMKGQTFWCCHMDDFVRLTNEEM